MCDRSHLVGETLDARARRAARRAGLEARRSRLRVGAPDNFGGYTLIDPFRNAIVAGERFDLTPQDVIEFCDQK
jgi:hypothetical protein